MDGVYFDSLHSYHDFGLILSSKNLSLPEPKVNSIEVPGANGSIDLSTVLTNGDVTYKNRNLSFVFTVIKNRDNWENIKSKFANYLHGQQIRIILDIDKSFFYTGRCKINNYSEEKVTAKISVMVDADPYKYELHSSVEQWKWDSFNFETGIIRNYKDLTVNGTYTLVIPARRKRIVPIFDCSEVMEVVYKGLSYSLPKGKSKIMNIWLEEGENRIVFIGNGIVSVDYRGASL